MKVPQISTVGKPVLMLMLASRKVVHQTLQRGMVPVYWFLCLMLQAQGRDWWMQKHWQVQQTTAVQACDQLEENEGAVTLAAGACH